jgi:hypothetical protein
MGSPPEYWQRKKGRPWARGFVAGFVAGALVVVVLLGAPRAWRTWKDRDVATGPTTTVDAAPRTTTGPPPRFYITREGSYKSRAEAEKKAAGLRRRFPHSRVHVLRSADFHGLHPGWWVPYVGPFPHTEQGRAAAQAAHRRLPGSVVDTIWRR